MKDQSVTLAEQRVMCPQEITDAVSQDGTMSFTEETVSILTSSSMLAHSFLIHPRGLKDQERDSRITLRLKRECIPAKKKDEGYWDKCKKSTKLPGVHVRNAASVTRWWKAKFWLFLKTTHVWKLSYWHLSSNSVWSKIPQIHQHRSAPLVHITKHLQQYPTTVHSTNLMLEVNITENSLVNSQAVLQQWKQYERSSS